MVTTGPYQLPEPEATKKVPLWREYWYVTFMVVAFAVLIITLLIRSFLPDPTPPTGQPNSWGMITPGFSTINQASQQLGTPINSQQTPQGILSTFRSYNDNVPHQVVADQGGTVRFAKEFIKSDTNHTLERYTSQYGQPDLELMDLDSSGALRAHVFLEEGLVVLAHIADDSVEQRWYFEPTDEATFLKSWGARLDEFGNMPEPFEP